MKLCFGDIVVVEGALIGVVVKSWLDEDGTNPRHDIYVRYFNEIRSYSEELVERYMVRHKYLSDEEIIYQDNAVNNRNTSFSEKLPDTLVKEHSWRPSVPIDELNLSHRAYNRLKRANIDNIDDILNMFPTQLSTICQLGKQTEKEIVSKIQTYIAENKLENDKECHIDIWKNRKVW